MRALFGSILTYHVVPGRTLSSDIAGEALEVETVEGSTVIDKVIMPSM
jgi:uncharacterized surface protein with fasciclin (FAS1) repeats